MVHNEIGRGERIAELLSSEVHGHDRGALGALSVTDAAEEVEPTADGALAFRIAAADEVLADVYVQPDRARVEFVAATEAAAATADKEALRVRPKAVEPPRTLVFVENGAEVKGALRVVRRAAADVL
ncbi:uncharacterized protein NP_1730A [Natronomonas pharaonis DSM 2160]|uniref:DUF7993 domain-containing protein n=1 Tax=Natronomonas pharaonis (strain ATCC 35678 / DSM 2160 / CIP 103997 / JCM 8858 / NBRC 14720 / NCIMB 2260 / Gabara) TaxID=348780 RepID=A0A1U7EVB5_NATPD|nr:hypothetical protein [Natronomonas pharaonis]CAI48956.1 uncharacterized protein NP_1730A [Natronomonas pharaonis DSM 2160]